MANYEYHIMNLNIVIMNYELCVPYYIIKDAYFMVTEDFPQVSQPLFRIKLLHLMSINYGYKGNNFLQNRLLP